MVRRETKGEFPTKDTHSIPKESRGLASFFKSGIKTMSECAKKAAFTLTEITLVIGLLLGLMLAGLSATGWFAKMSDAKKAESVL